MIIGSCFFYSNWEIKNIDLIIMGSLIFGIQIKITSDLLCQTILILPHPTLLRSYPGPCTTVKQLAFKNFEQGQPNSNYTLKLINYNL